MKIESNKKVKARINNPYNHVFKMSSGALTDKGKISLIGTLNTRSRSIRISD